MGKKYYAVKYGKPGGSGVYLTWDECRAQVEGVSGAVYKSFPTMEEAKAFLQEEPKKAEESDGQPLPFKEGVAVAYVDGSYHSATGEFACGAVLFYEGRQLEFSKKYQDERFSSMHNVAGEIMGAVTVIRYCLEQQIPALEIHHDYEGVAKWATGQWKAAKPGTQAYARVCQRAGERIKLTFVKVRGHSGDTWNDRADRLAKQALGLL